MRFVPNLFPLFGFDGVQEGLTGLNRSRNRWGFKADRVLIYATAGLSRRCPRAPLVEEQDISAGVFRDVDVISPDL